MEAASPPPPPPPPPPPAPPPPPSNFGQHRQLSFQEAVSDGFSKYVEFNGRSSRSAFWWWVLFAFLVSIVANIIDAILGTSPLFSLIVGLGLLRPASP